MRVTELGLKLAAEFLTEGYDAVQGEAPYRIALIRNGQAFCSGNMVNLEWFVTTAACNLRISKNYFLVFLSIKKESKYLIILKSTVYTAQYGHVNWQRGNPVGVNTKINMPQDRKFRIF